MKIIGMILTYNNEHMIEQVLKKIPKGLFDEIFVTDDNSIDNTKNIYIKKDIKVFSNKRKRGYGSNVKNGLQVAIDNFEFDYLVELHGDGAQFDPSATYDAKFFMENKYDFIIGSRFIDKQTTKKSGMSYLRYYSNIILSFLAEKAIKLGITEYHTGFRIYSKNYLKKVNWQDCSDGHLFSFETLCLVKYHNLKIAEVKCYCDYNNLHTSISIINAIIFTFQHFYTMLEFLLAKFNIEINKIFKKK